MTCDLVKFASQCGKKVTEELSTAEQKRLGHFLTPPIIARFMAQRAVAKIDKEHIRILEPASGAGILVAATIEAILNKTEKPKSIHLILFEIDERLLPALRLVVRKIRQEVKKRSISLVASIRNEDFLLSNEARKQQPVADFIISNPPYFKISAKDRRALLHQYAVHGQPNIYGLFMAACAGMLSPEGRWCFITPRSWTNGTYFAAVRRALLKNMNLDAIHVFNSRKEHFHEDEILQEAIITWATAQSPASGQVQISSSDGIKDLYESQSSVKPIYQVVGSDKEQHISIRLGNPATWLNYPFRLATYGLKVSTGPVIAFRSKHFIHEVKAKNTVPLLWMQHVTHNRIQWPIKKKREHIAAMGQSEWMLVPNSPMVVLRRFSPKEDERRVTAAGYTATLSGASIGLENHLNYIYRPGGQLGISEVRGLAAFLNSRFVDDYFRSEAGSTQINASELRNLPLPPIEQLIAIGRRCWEGIPLSKMDHIVDEVLTELQVPNWFSKQG
jgi:adenine-specific DNA-methyltransferase